MSVEFVTKFSNVKFSVVPEERRVNPDELSPGVREAYDRIVKAGGAQFVSMTKNGDLRASGTFTQIRKDGKERRNQVWVAYTSQSKNGNVLDFAGDMIAKFSGDPKAVGFAKVRVVPGRDNGKGGKFNDLNISFPETEEERKAKFAAKGNREKVEENDEIPF